VKGVDLEDIRAITSTLPRSEEHLIRESVKFRIRSLVYAAVSPDETTMGFAFPKEERAALVAAEPEKFLMPVKSDERYNWVRVRLAEIDEVELRELVVEAWRMCVPKFISAMVPG
jgi:hypothetical protein